MDGSTAPGLGAIDWVVALDEDGWKDCSATWPSSCATTSSIVLVAFSLQTPPIVEAVSSSFIISL